MESMDSSVAKYFCAGVDDGRRPDPRRGPKLIEWQIQSTMDRDASTNNASEAPEDHDIMGAMVSSAIDEPTATRFVSRTSVFVETLPGSARWISRTISFVFARVDSFSSRMQ